MITQKVWTAGFSFFNLVHPTTNDKDHRSWTVVIAITRGMKIKGGGMGRGKKKVRHRAEI